MLFVRVAFVHTALQSDVPSRLQTCFFFKKNTCLIRFRRKHLTEVKSKIDTGGGGGGTGGGGGGSGGNSRANSKKVRGSVKSNKKKKPPNLNNLVRGKEN